jgi:SAM-dependent methyltransferase
MRSGTCDPLPPRSRLRCLRARRFSANGRPRAVAHPGVEFVVGDLRRLPVGEASLAGIVCFYSLIHLESDQLAPTLAALRRTLRPGGRLLIAVHEGHESREPGELWGIPVSLRFNFFTYEQLTRALRDGGFVVEQITHRASYPDVEVETDRLYASATAPATQTP